MTRFTDLLKFAAVTVALAAGTSAAHAQQVTTGTGIGADISTTAPRPTLIQPISHCLSFTGITKAKCLAGEKIAKPQSRSGRTTARR